jgi:hypothetical protein
MASALRRAQRLTNSLRLLPGIDDIRTKIRVEGAVLGALRRLDTLAPKPGWPAVESDP